MQKLHGPGMTGGKFCGPAAARSEVEGFMETANISYPAGTLTGSQLGGESVGLANVLGRSPAMKSVFELIQRVAPTEATVLITGESGAGKELVADAIHQLSSRASGPMVAINCGSIPASLIEAELFGYEKGSFTGASRSHAGV